MSRSEIMAKRLGEVLLNGRWIANTNIKAQIEAITWHQAIEKIGTLNTIAALTFHVNYYLGGLIAVFEGGPLEIRDKYSFDLKPIKSEADWRQLVDDFIANASIFIAHIEKMPDSKFDEAFINEQYGTYQRNIEGVVEHAYYHLGQMSLLKKMILAKEK